MVKKIFNIITYIPIFILVVFSLFIFSTTRPLPNNYQFFTVMSGSMEPTIKTGSLILTQKMDVYKVGDIITFKTKNSSKTVTHRIDKIDLTTKIVNSGKTQTQGETKGEYITRGDANDAPDDQTVIKENIIGKLVYPLPYFGYVISFSKTLPGLIFLIIIPATIVIYSEFLTIKNESIRLIKERRTRKLTPLENIEEKIGEEIIDVGKDVKKLITKPKKIKKRYK